MFSILFILFEVEMKGFKKIKESNKKYYKII